MRGYLLFILLIVLLSSIVSATLGITPAKREFNFVPGEDLTIIYTIINDDPQREVTIYTEGDLSEYATLSKTSAKGAGTFSVTLNLPQSIDIPGEKNLLIGVKEIPDESQFLGTAINVRALIKIQVPYPGKYIQPQLSVSDGNIDEELPVELRTINRGKEGVTVTPLIEFYSGENEKVHTMTFTPVFVNQSEDRYFRKFLSTSGYLPGNYLAKAIIDYSGDTITINDTFRVGSLFIDIINFTTRLPQGSIQRFNVNIESRWNGKMDSIYADVNITGQGESIEFRTPSIDLEAWQTDTLTGFLDTSQLSGVYDTKVTLNYAGEQTILTGTLTIYETDYLTIIVIVGVIIILIIALIIAIILLRRKRK